MVAVVLLSWLTIWQVAAEVTIDLRRPNAVDVVLFGVDADDHFGTDLAVGDVNGDGVRDLAVGAYKADGPANARDRAGEVHVYYGRSEADWRAGGVSPDITVYGADITNWLGGDMSKEPGHVAVGDLDDDGVGDLVLGAPEFGHGTRLSTRGRVWVIWGDEDVPAKIDLASIPAELGVTTFTPGGKHGLGAALATGDFDGDGVDDVAMSAPSAADGVGAVYVVYGGSHLRNRDIEFDDVPEDVAVFQVLGEVRGIIGGTKLGSYLALGDLSGDGVDDLAIGAEHAQASSGLVRVVFGGGHLRDTTWDLADVPANWSAEPEEAADQLGSALAIADFNADEAPDLLIGARSADGPAGRDTGQAIGVVGPLSDGAVRDFQSAPGDLIIYGPQGLPDFSYLGESVAIGDFNDDDVGDVLVGARSANGLGRTESGIVYAFYGTESLSGVVDLEQEPADITFIGAYEDDFTGYVTAGDVTGDGVDDMIFSADWRNGPDGERDIGAVYVLFGDEDAPTPMPTLTPTATSTSTPTPTQTPTPTITSTPQPSKDVLLPVVLRNYAISP